jgi:hypothetical protein
MNYFINVYYNIQLIKSLIALAVQAGFKDTGDGGKGGTLVLYPNKLQYCLAPNSPFSYVASSATDDIILSSEEAINMLQKMIDEKNKPVYKEGDWVKLVSKRPYSWNSIGLMDNFLSSIQQIKRLYIHIGDHRVQFQDSKTDGWSFRVVDIERHATPEEIEVATRSRIEVGKYYKIRAEANYMGNHIIKVKSIVKNGLHFDDLTDKDWSGWMGDQSPNFQSLVPATEEEIAAVKPVTNPVTMPIEHSVNINGYNYYTSADVQEGSNHIIRLQRIDYSYARPVFLDKALYDKIGIAMGWKDAV